MAVWTSIFLLGTTVWSITVHPTLAEGIRVLHYQQIATGREDPGTQELFENIPSPIACAVHAATNSKGGYAYYQYKRLCLTATFFSPGQDFDNNRTIYRATQFIIPMPLAGESIIQAPKPIHQVTKVHRNGSSDGKKSPEDIRETHNSAKRALKRKRLSALGRFMQRENFVFEGQPTSCRLEGPQQYIPTIASGIRRSDIVLVTTGGYIFYLNIKNQQVVYGTQVHCRGVIGVSYKPFEHMFWLTTQSLSTHVNMITRMVRSKRITRQYALKTIEDPVNHMKFTLRRSSIVLQHAIKRAGRQPQTSIPVKNPLDVIIDSRKRLFLLSHVKDGAITITQSSYFGSGRRALQTNMKTLNSFQIERKSGKILLCNSEGVFEEPSPIKDVGSCPCTRLIGGACLAIKEWNNILVALIYVNDLKQAAVYLLCNGQMQRRLVPLNRLPDDAGKWEIQPLLDNLMANQVPRPNLRWG